MYEAMAMHATTGPKNLIQPLKLDPDDADWDPEEDEWMDLQYTRGKVWGAEVSVTAFAVIGTGLLTCMHHQPETDEEDRPKARKGGPKGKGKGVADGEKKRAAKEPKPGKGKEVADGEKKRVSKEPKPVIKEGEKTGKFPAHGAWR